jgi:hypothetical protein
MLGKMTLLISQGKNETTEGRWWATYFLLALLCRGVVGAPVRLFWELRHIGLICMDDQWAWSPLATRAAPVACGSGLFMTFGTPRMVPGVVDE